MRGGRRGCLGALRRERPASIHAALPRRGPPAGLLLGNGPLGVRRGTAADDCAARAPLREEGRRQSLCRGQARIRRMQPAPEPEPSRALMISVRSSSEEERQGGDSGGFVIT